ncbi:hypothetical protein F8O07_06960 [Pseudoclavibacter sp. CFCC 13796]|uniref:hypothetical protein n=1 Tax=Pseudoclavibacter sp. CFCC 13796 TaxID=2615179 RepID=UPI0013012A88|nr:hypothetical protein [Pseudoclavibacter sp. CFCC 13796]KAB1661639.1 hypothetical protein F8O07_06960 [Pseudoclavibacter sp. CFCC 13796]
MDTSIIAAFIGAGSGAVAGQFGSFVYQAYNKSTREAKMFTVQTELTKLDKERKNRNTVDGKIFHRFHATCIREQFISALYSNPCNPFVLVLLGILLSLAMIFAHAGQPDGAYFFGGFFLFLLTLLLCIGGARWGLRRRLDGRCRKYKPSWLMCVMTTVKMTEDEVRSLYKFLSAEDNEDQKAVENSEQEGAGKDDQGEA